MRQISDEGAIEKIVDDAIAANAAIVAEYKAGKEKAFNSLVGKVMAASQGKANPAQVNAILKRDWAGFMLRILARGLRAVATASAHAQTPALPKALVRNYTSRRRPERGAPARCHDQALDRRFRRHARAALHPRRRAVQPHDLLHRQGDRARHRRRARARLRAWLNKKYAKELGKRPLTIYIGAYSRDRLLPQLTEGYVDIALGNLTVTDERLKIVDFVAPKGALTVNEIVVTGPASPAIATVDDLSGKAVHVRRTSSYYDSLIALNDRFKAAGKAPVKIVLVPDALEDEDMMEMTNSGLLEIMVVDDWKAKIWVNALPKLKVHDKIELREGASVGWAIRKDSPKLKAELNEFYTDWVKKQGVDPVPHGAGDEAREGARESFRRLRLQALRANGRPVREVREAIRIRSVMLAAQGYQESTLDQNKRSRVGAIGVMQIMPATGESLKVGDIKIIEPNIHGGAKYMDELITKYLSDGKFDNQNRTLFGFASYNAGPGNISRMRKEAVERGLDPNIWFNNVEVVTAEKIGLETTTYVRNIYKYYVAYRLILDSQERAMKAREALQK